jgi:hypothetical protein
MPIYRARNIAIRLVACSLNDCTSSIECSREEAIRYENALRQGPVLQEQLISDPTSDPPDLKLRLIDCGVDQVPLYVAYVPRGPPSSISQRTFSHSTRHHKPDTKDDTAQETDGNQVRADEPTTFVPTKIDPDCQPYALGIIINLSKAAAQDNSPKQSSGSDLRYDVFLNGDLVCSEFVRAQQLKSQEASQILVSGQRCDHFLEHPIVILPHGLNPKGDISDSNRPKCSVREKWRMIGEAFHKHAKDLRYWFPKSPLAYFFDTLGEYELSQKLEALHPKGPQHFGIIDVVISRGSSSPFHKADKYLDIVTLLQKGQSLPQDLMKHNVTSSPFEGSHRKRKSSSQLRQPVVNSQAHQSIPGAPSSMTRSRNSVESLNGACQTPSHKTVPLKRRCLPSLVNPTLMPKMGSIEDSSGRKTVSGFKQTVFNSRLDKPPASVSSNGPAPNSRGTTGGGRRPVKRDRSTVSHAFSTPEKVVQNMSHAKGMEDLTPVNKGLRIQNKIKVIEEDEAQKPSDVVWWQAADIEAWTNPVLCRGSCVAYAEDGRWKTGMDKAGPVRHIKELRSGNFEESEVVFATRYFIC